MNTKNVKRGKTAEVLFVRKNLREIFTMAQGRVVKRFDCQNTLTPLFFNTEVSALTLLDKYRHHLSFSVPKLLSHEIR